MTTSKLELGYPLLLHVQCSKAQDSQVVIVPIRLLIAGNALPVGRFTVNKVNFFLDVENNSKNVDTKFHCGWISVYEVIESINVNFLFIWSIFFIRSIFAFLLFLRVSTLEPT